MPVKPRLEVSSDLSSSPGDPIPGPPPGGWPSHHDALRDPVPKIARWGVLLALVMFLLGAFALCCGTG